ncbi:MAG: host specificity factor TipJ family phage tail protein [Pseudomonadota bacterium]
MPTCQIALTPFDKPGRPYKIDAGQSVAQFLTDYEIGHIKDMAVVIGDQWLAPTDYEQRIIKAGDKVIVVRLPGFLKKLFKNPIARLVANIGLMIAAPHIGGAIAKGIGLSGNAFTIAGQSVSWGSVIGSGVAVVGNAAIGALAGGPAARPSLNWAGGNEQAPSPTYTLGGQGNMARLGQPIPVLYGRHIVYPDFAARPWAQYINNEMYLHQLHVISAGKVAVEQIRIDDTPISNFREITHEIIPPGGEVSLFNPHVATAAEVSSQDLTSEWLGPFPAAPKGQPVDRIEIDITAPNGLFRVDNQGNRQSLSGTVRVEYRALSGGEWTARDITKTSATAGVKRWSESWEVPAGEYEVRVRRVDTERTDIRSAHKLQWGGLKGFMTARGSWEGLTLLAIKMQATNNLNERTARMINVVATRKLPIWRPGGGWSAPKPTRSPIWAFVDVVRASYGGDDSDATALDLPNLSRLARALERAKPAPHFDGVFDTSTAIWEGLARIARQVQARPVREGGTIRLVRDIRPAAPAVMFTPRNIVKNSLSIQYKMPESKGVLVEYMRAGVWKPDDVTVGPEAKPLRIRAFGCTTPEQATTIARYLYAASRYRRQIITFVTEMEGLIPSYGDQISIHHDLPAWGQTSEIIDCDIIDQDRLKVRLSPGIDWSEQPDRIVVRKRDGRPSDTYPCARGALDDEVIIEGTPITPPMDIIGERPHAVLGKGDDWRCLAKVISIRPRANQVQITAIIDDDRVYSLEGIPTPQ